MPQTVYVAAAPVVVPAWNTTRGDTVLDSVSKSSMTVPDAYRDTNACGVEAFQVFSGSIQVNQLINCIPTPAGNLSIKGRIPADGTDADVTVMANTLLAAILLKIPAA